MRAPRTRRGCGSRARAGRWLAAADHEALIREAGLAPARRALGDFPLPIVGLVAIRKLHDLLDIERLLLEWRHHLVGNDVVDEIRAHRSRIAEIARLDRRRPK